MTGDTIHVCTGCGQKLRVPADKRTQVGTCPRCWTTFAPPAGRPSRRAFHKWLLRGGLAAAAGAAVGGYYLYDRYWVPLPEFPPGTNASLQGRRIFPADDPWNRDISDLPTDPASDSLIAAIGAERPLRPDFGRSRRGMLAGIPYWVVSGPKQPTPVAFEIPDESDPGPYPIPLDSPIEGAPKPTGDRHVLVIDWDEWKLYELFAAHPEGGLWRAGSGAVFDLTRGTSRPKYWTSADAAGLPILPGLVRYDEVYEQGAITHALRFTAPYTRRAFAPPATHFASGNRDPLLPPMGMRVRLKDDFDLDRFPEDARVVLRALQKYGMFVADNGMPWGLTGTADPRWPRSLIDAMRTVQGRDFEVVMMTDIVTD